MRKEPAVSEKVVLLVEDNPDDVELALLAFKEVKSPYKIVVARDGVEALDFLQARGRHKGRPKSEVPALILLDLKLPRVNGLEVLAAIRKDPLLRYVLVAILTSSNEEKDHAEALDLGANLYFRKPMDFTQFVETVRRVDTLVSAS